MARILLNSASVVCVKVRMLVRYVGMYVCVSVCVFMYAWACVCRVYICVFVQTNERMRVSEFLKNKAKR